MGYGMDSSFVSWHEQETVPLPTAFRSFLDPIQPSTQRLMWALSLAVKQLRGETDHSPPSRAEVNNGRAIPPFLYTSSWRTEIKTL
jgi:hypothetical protein